MTITVFPVDAVSGSPTYAGQNLRDALSVLCGYAPTSRPLGATSGVRPGTPTNTVTATSTTWTVKPHSGVVDAESAAAAGPYLYASDANTTGSVTAANATNPRIDIIYARVDDPSQGDGSTTPAVSFQYQAGTAAASPTAPSPSVTPSTRALVLANISVPASGGGSPSVTWVAPTFGAIPQHYAVNPGATIPNNTDTTVAGWTITSSSGMGTISGGVRTIAVAGMYRIDATLTEPSTATGYFRGRIQVNGNTVDTDGVATVSSRTTAVKLDVTMPLNVGDTVQIIAFQNSGSSQTLTAGTDGNHWSIAWLGPV